MEVISLLTVNTIGFCVLGIPAYFFCAIIGFVLTTCVYMTLILSKNYDITQSVKILFISICGMAIGAKLFGFMTGIYRSIGMNQNITLKSIFDTGIVFYGGLCGLLVTYTICLKSKYCNLDMQALNILAVCVPLFHSIARMGCFLSGCCYGRIYKEIMAVRYITTIENSRDVNLRFPVQIVEAAVEVWIFIYLLTLLKNNEWKNKKILFRYLALYSLARFFLEFLRGDFRRGIICGVSFSQSISVLIWVALIIKLLLEKKRFQRKKKEDCND